MQEVDQINLEGRTVERFTTCARCGRSLRAAQSVMAGYGHKCAEHVFFAELREARLAEADMREIEETPISLVVARAEELREREV